MSAFDVKLTVIRRILDQLETPYQSNSVIRVRVETAIASRLSKFDIQDLEVIIAARRKYP